MRPFNIILIEMHVTIKNLMSLRQFVYRVPSNNIGRVDYGDTIVIAWQLTSAYLLGLHRDRNV
jgi:hypothetical protein